MTIAAQDLVRASCLEVLESRVAHLEPLRRSTLVVAGGTGFVGTWIAEMVAALNDKHSFGTQLALISRGTDQFASRLPHLGNRSDIRLIKSDVRLMREFPMEAQWVVHAAASPDVRLHASTPLETMSVILDGTMAVLRTAERLGQLKMLLNLSSGLVCGSQPNDLERMSEDCVGAPPPDASFAYANAKRMAETMCAAARTQSRIPTISARPFSFIGPYQALDTPWAQTNFMSDAFIGNSIRVWGDGETVRSYLYGADAAFWMLRILTAGESGQVFNVGSDQPVKLLNLASEISKNFSPTPEIKLNSSSMVRPRNRLVPEIARARKELGLDVFTPFQTAVQRTVNWHRMNKTNKV